MRKDGEAYDQVVVEFSKSEAGQERRGRIAAERELQMQRLLNKWLDIRGKRLFCRLVQQYRNAEFIQLSDDLRSLPVESSFNDLNSEIDRIFLSGTEKVSPEELQTLMNSVLTAEGFDLSAATDLLELGRMSPEAAELYDDPTTPTWKNLNMLELQIAGDLAGERKELVQIQYALVEKIADTRRKKLLTLPLETGSDATMDVNTPDLGRVILERILSELRDEVRLLPETADRIRGVSDPVPGGRPELITRGLRHAALQTVCCHLLVAVRVRDGELVPRVQDAPVPPDNSRPSAKALDYAAAAALGKLMESQSYTLPEEKVRDVVLVWLRKDAHQPPKTMPAVEQLQGNLASNFEEAWTKMINKATAGLDPDGKLEVAKRLRASLENSPWQNDAKTKHDDLLKKELPKALERVKEAGPNRRSSSMTC